MRERERGMENAPGVNVRPEEPLKRSRREKAGGEACALLFLPLSLLAGTTRDRIFLITAQIRTHLATDGSRTGGRSKWYRQATARSGWIRFETTSNNERVLFLNVFNRVIEERDGEVRE